MARLLISLLLFTGVCLLACEDSGEEAARPVTSTEEQEDEPSPNAKILPEPLAEGAGRRGTGGLSGAGFDLIPSPPEPRPTPEPFPLDGAPAEDHQVRGVGGGYRAVAQLRWPTARSSVKFPSGDRVLWPTLTVELLRERPDSAARMRWVLKSETFPFPSDSEFRFRADRLGALVLWPDQRSFRLISEGSLRSVFLDRRVDRVPFVEAKVEQRGVATRLDRPTKVVQIRSSIATAELQLTEVRDLPYAGQLLCHALLEWIRVKANPEICALGSIPLALHVTWSSGQEFVFELTELAPAFDLNLDHFRTPPDLPIFKPGELPPRENRFFSKAETKAVFPVTDEKGPLVAETQKALPDIAHLSASAFAPLKRPQNEITLENVLDRPLVVFVGKLPFARLAPQESTTFYLQKESVTISAHDFFRERMVEEKEVIPPKTVRLGAKEEAPSAPP